MGVGGRVPDNAFCLCPVLVHLHDAFVGVIGVVAAGIEFVSAFEHFDAPEWLGEERNEDKHEQS